MEKFKVINVDIYRWRYSLGYISVGILLFSLLIMGLFFIPDGITKQEMSSTVVSSNMSIQNFKPEMIVNAPYHLLQKLSFVLFEVSNFSIKLPSTILAFFSAIGMLLLLKKWFKQNVAVLTVLLMITTGNFLLLSQTGTDAIQYVFLATWLLLAATMSSEKSKHFLAWRIAFVSLAALSLYSPYGIYFLLAFISAVAVHPHLRHIVNSTSAKNITTDVLLGVVFIAPLAICAFLQPDILLRLIGVPSETVSLQANLSQLAHQYLNFMNPTNGAVLTPVFGLTSLLLAAIGLYRILSTKYTAKSYIIIGWIVIIIPIMILKPEQTSVTFVPILLCTAFCVDYLIRYWYKLFPSNPYARAAGLIPLGILVASIAFTGVEHFAYGYSYGKTLSSSLSKDLSLIRLETAESKTKATLRVSPEQESFYLAVKKYQKQAGLSITTDASVRAEKLIVARNARASTDPLTPSKIITSSYYDASDRFYVYKNASN